MSERRKEILEEMTFLPIFGEDGYFPPAPPEAIEEYGRLKKGWLLDYPEIPGVSPEVVLYPANLDGKIRYIVAKQIIIAVS